MQKNQGIAFTQSDIWLQAPWKNCNNDEKQHQAASGSQPTLIYLSASYLQIGPRRHVHTIQVSLMDEMPLHLHTTRTLSLLRLSTVCLSPVYCQSYYSLSSPP